MEKIIRIVAVALFTIVTNSTLFCQLDSANMLVVEFEKSSTYRDSLLILVEIQNTNLNQIYTGNDYHHFDLDSADKPVRFFIYDLMDTLNNSFDVKNVRLIKGHMYHFAGYDNGFSISNLLYLTNDKVIIFKMLGTKWNKSSSEDLRKYFENELENTDQKEAILDRIMNYRKYGKYWYG